MHCKLRCAVVRYRAYSSKGLSAAEVGVLVALCSFTFGLGTVLLGGFVLTALPEIVQRIYDIPPWAARGLGLAMLAFVCLYILGSLRHFAPLKVGGFNLVYPRPPVALRQLFAAPLELIGDAGIIYFALPEAGNPGYLIVLGTALVLTHNSCFAFVGAAAAAVLAIVPQLYWVTVWSDRQLTKSAAELGFPIACVATTDDVV